MFWFCFCSNQIRDICSHVDDGSSFQDAMLTGDLRVYYVPTVGRVHAQCITYSVNNWILAIKTDVTTLAPVDTWQVRTVPEMQENGNYSRGCLTWSGERRWRAHQDRDVIINAISIRKLLKGILYIIFRFACLSLFSMSFSCPAINRKSPYTLSIYCIQSRAYISFQLSV